jgi:hypothetical protein
VTREPLTSTIGELTGLRPAYTPTPSEDEATKAIESFTGSLPSTTYLALAIIAMAVSLAAQLGGRGKWGNFIA